MTLSDREKAAYVYGFGCGMKCVNPSPAAFEALVNMFFHKADEFLKLLADVKPDISAMMAFVAEDISVEAERPSPSSRN